MRLFLIKNNSYGLGFVYVKRPLVALIGCQMDLALELNNCYVSFPIGTQVYYVIYK